MNNLLIKLFPQGQRKLMVSLIALVIGVALEKFAGGLTANMETSLIAIVAIFTGGNVMEHLANALKIVKGTKVGQVIEDVLPGDQGLGTQVVQEEEGDYITERFDSLEDIQKRQAANIEALVKHINAIYARLPQPVQPAQPV